jgi:hypothetical protein
LGPQSNGYSGKVTAAWYWPSVSIWYRSLECVEVMPIFTTPMLSWSSTYDLFYLWFI